MDYPIALIFILPWALGLATSYTLGGFIDVLVFVAVVLFLVRIIKGRFIEDSGRGKLSRYSR